MNEVLKKTKSADSLLDEYLDNITEKCKSQIPIVKKQQKVVDEKIKMPTINTYNELIYYNYNVNQLKTFAKNYKLKISGNKNELVSRLYNFLYFSHHIIKIQKVFRSFLVKKYKLLHGPASFNRKLCNNSDDFISMEPIEEINFHQFISYKDTDGFIYGFDITSLHNLFLKSVDDIKNPYNRNLIPDKVFKDIRLLIRLSRMLKIHINLNLDDDTKKVSNDKAIELRVRSLFQTIDSLGNYSNADWFITLNRNQLIKFMRELVDIWQYRANLSNKAKKDICPPLGNPFQRLPNYNILQTLENLDDVRKIILEILEKLVNTGIDKDNKCLGAYYVLSAITLVNHDAATSLPWLYDAAYHM